MADDRIEERLAKIQARLDEIIEVCHEAGGEMQRIGALRGMSPEQWIAEASKFMNRAGGQFKKIERLRG